MKGAWEEESKEVKKSKSWGWRVQGGIGQIG